MDSKGSDSIIGIAGAGPAGLASAITLACREGTVFDAGGRAYPVRSRAPLFYTVVRGPGLGTLDAAQLAQARGLGVEVRFNDRLATLPGRGVLAIGPKAADAIAVGYHFDTAMADGVWLICDDALAPLVCSSIVGRALYGLVGNGGYRWLLRSQLRGDARVFLHRLYRPSWLKRLLVPWARHRILSWRKDASCDHVDCQCVWCRCGAEAGT